MSNNKKKKPAKPTKQKPLVDIKTKHPAFINHGLGVPYAEANDNTQKWMYGHLHGDGKWCFGNHEPFKPRPQLAVQMEKSQAESTCKLLTELQWFLKGNLGRDLDGDSDITHSHIRAIAYVIRDIESAQKESAEKAKSNTITAAK